VRPAEELAVLGRFYGLDVDAVGVRLAPSLEAYAEWVLDCDGFAVVTLGDAGTVAPFATGAAADRLRASAVRWPDAVTGVKLDLGARHPPTVYIRPTCPWEEGVRFLAGIGIDVRALPAARTLYGLGFQGGLVKTYALCSDGFVSWRIDTDGLRPEHKRYRAEVPWDGITWPDPCWERVGALGRQLGFRTAGHVAASSAGGCRRGSPRASGSCERPIGRDGAPPLHVDLPLARGRSR
jgi:hypothetical protein